MSESNKMKNTTFGGNQQIPILVQTKLNHLIILF